MLDWRLVIAVLMAAVLAFIILSYDEEQRGSRVVVAPPSVLEVRAATEPFCLNFHHFCVVRASSGEFLALYTFDPHPVFRGQGCAVEWLADLTYVDPDEGDERQGAFRSVCTSSTFDIEGRKLSGNAPRDLDGFEVEIIDRPDLFNPPLPGMLDTKVVEVDTRVLICGTTREDWDDSCQRAPAGD